LSVDASHASVSDVGVRLVVRRFAGTDGGCVSGGGGVYTSGQLSAETLPATSLARTV
jgi:hypothetical protein